MRLLCLGHRSTCGFDRALTRSGKIQRTCRLSTVIHLELAWLEACMVLAGDFFHAAKLACEDEIQVLEGLLGKLI